MKVKLIRKTTLTAISFDVLYLIAEFTSAQELLSLRLSCRQLYTTLSSNASNTIWYRKRKELGLPGEKDIVNFKYDSDRWLVALSVGNHCSHCGGSKEIWKDPVHVSPEIQFILGVRLCYDCVMKTFVELADLEYDINLKSALNLFDCTRIRFESLFPTRNKRNHKKPWPTGVCVYLPAFLITQWTHSSLDSSEKDDYLKTMRTKKRVNASCGPKIRKFIADFHNTEARAIETAYRNKLEARNTELRSRFQALGFTDADFRDSGFDTHFFVCEIDLSLEVTGIIWLNTILPTLRIILKDARRRRRLKEGENAIFDSYNIYKTSLSEAKRRFLPTTMNLLELPLLQSLLHNPNFEYSASGWNAMQDQVWHSVNSYVYSFEVASYKHIYEANQIILARCSKTAPFPTTIQQSSTSLPVPPSTLATGSNSTTIIDLNIQDKIEEELNKYCNRLTCSSCKAACSFTTFMQCSDCHCRTDNTLNQQQQKFFQSSLSINPSKILAIKILFYWGGITGEDYSWVWENIGKREERWTCGDCCDVGKNIMRNGSTPGGRLSSGFDKKREGNVAVDFGRMALHLMNYHFVLKGDSVWLPPKIYFDSVDGASTRFNEFEKERKKKLFGE